MILRDPVHGLVAFEGDEEGIVTRLLDTREVQRLRAIRQLGVTALAFPGAEHTRFSHALGTAFVMKLLLARLRSADEDLPFWQRITTDRARDALAAAFLHDLGHGPLSHLFEDAIEGAPRHELWTERILLSPHTEVHGVLAACDPGMPERVAGMVRGEHPLPYLAKAVSGTFDVDRCDYLLRDAHATGVHYGHFDLAWLLRSLRFAPSADANTAPSLAIDGAKGLPAIEAFILARLFMFQQVYLHKATRAAEWMIAAAMRRALTRARDGVREGLPAALRQAAIGDEVALDDYLELDDAVLAVSVRGWEGSRDAGLADLAKRIRARKLHKTLELFAEHATAAGQARALGIARDIANGEALDPELAVGLDTAEDTPFEDRGEAPMVVYAKGPARPLAEVSFLLGRLAGQSLRRIRLIIAPELRDKVTRALAT